MIQDELDRMNRFVDDLLLLVRASRPDFLRPEPLDLDLLTHDVFAKARLLGDRAWIAGRHGDRARCSGDPQRLTQALMNLAENAVRHTQPGEPIWIGSSLERERGSALGARRGPGHRPGGPAAYLRALRARDERLRGSSGAGLGLAIVKAIAEAHGGRVELEPAGTGAHFELVIPAAGDDDPASGRPAAGEPA